MAGISCLLCTYWCLDNQLLWYLTEKCKECQTYCGSPRSFFFLTVSEWIPGLIFNGQKLVPKSSTRVFFSNKHLSDNMIRLTLETCWLTLQTNLINIETTLQNSLLVWNSAWFPVLFLLNPVENVSLYRTINIMLTIWRHISLKVCFLFYSTVWRHSPSPGQLNGPPNLMKVHLHTPWHRHKHTLRFCLLTARCCVSPAWRWQVSRLTSTPRRPHGPGRCRPKLPTCSPITPRRSECPTRPPFRWLIPAAASVRFLPLLIICADKK